MQHHRTLIEEIDAFIAATGMGESYFGKKATGNSELVSRLRQGKSVLVTTDQAVRTFIADNHPSDSAPVAGADSAEGSLPESKRESVDAGIQGPSCARDGRAS